MTGTLARWSTAKKTIATPVYEARLRRHGASDTEIEVWQLPSPASPQLSAPRRIAGLRGRNLALVEHRVLRLLAAAGAAHTTGGGAPVRRALAEDVALRLGLLFRALAPMRNRDAMRAVAEGIEAMTREEASYWLGMAMHRRNPRRVLTALRILLTDPKAPARRA
ncbi:MAG: hypothetical protein N2588_11180 [Rhodovarius sp.]|nr:hypothetical protein [Rhodovarius sp.]